MTRRALSAKMSRKLKGSVLFTVLVVMVVMLIMLITTIGLANVASKRAYAEYNQTQATTTARSFINSVVSSFQKDGDNYALGKEVYKAVLNNTKSSSTMYDPYTLYLAGGNDLGNGLGHVEKIEFSYAGKDSLGNYYVNGSDYMIMKVTATVRAGDQVTTYTEYLSDMNVVPGAGGNGGFISTAGASLEGPAFSVLGPIGNGISKKFEKNIEGSGLADTISKLPAIQLANAGYHVDGNQFLRGRIETENNTLYLYDKNMPANSYSDGDMSAANYEGMMILGDFWLNNNAPTFAARTNESEVRNRPYLFVAGKFNCTTDASIGAITDGTPNSTNVKEYTGNKMNLYCGSFILSKKNHGVHMVSDIYCYDEGATSEIVGSSAGSSLTDWVGKILNGGSQGIYGNIYTKGSLRFGSESDKQATITLDGDIYIEGNLDLKYIDTNASGWTPNVDSGRITIVKPSPTASVDDCKKKILVDNDRYGTDSKYTDYVNNFISKIKWVDNKAFPANMELSEILGINFNSASLTGSQQLEAIIKRDYTLPDESVSLSNKIIKNELEIRKQFYKTDGTMLNSMSSYAGDTTPGPAAGPSGNRDGVKVFISNTTDAAPDGYTKYGSCVLSGHYTNGSKILIRPSENPGEPLWILLDGTHFDSDTQIIIEDNIYDDHDNFVSKRAPVYFYIKDGTSVTIEKSTILTKKYSEYITNKTLSSDLSLVTTPDAEFIPNVYIYGTNKEKGGTTEKLTMLNNSVITGYIVAPNCEVTMTDLGNTSSKTLTYNGTPFTGLKIGVIGSMIVGPTGGHANNFCMIYINNGGGTPTPTMETFAFKPLPGHSNY